MKLTVNIFLVPKIGDAVEKLRAAGPASARFVTPWNEKAWAVDVEVSDIKWTCGLGEDQLYLNVGWMLGVMGVPNMSAADFAVDRPAEEATCANGTPSLR